jgi:hypothetical protein
MEFMETFQAAERIIVSPAGGVYEPLAGRDELEPGDVIGHITVAGATPVPVCSPFRGRLVETVAWRGERVARRQRIAWLRVA